MLVYLSSWCIFHVGVFVMLVNFSCLCLSCLCVSHVVLVTVGVSVMLGLFQFNLNIVTIITEGIHIND